MDSMILTLLIFLPVFGAAIMLPASKIWGKDNSNIFKWIALVITGLQLVLLKYAHGTTYCIIILPFYWD